MFFITSVFNSSSLSLKKKVNCSTFSPNKPCIKMKCILIFVLFLVKFSESYNFKCGLSDAASESIEFYCEHYAGNPPESCSSSFTLENIVDKSKVLRLKIGGCDDTIMDLVGDFPNLHSLDLSHGSITSVTNVSMVY